MDWEDVGKLAGIMDDHGLVELEFEDEKLRIHLKKPGAIAATGVSYAPSMAPAVAAAPASAGASASAASAAPAPAVVSGKKITCPFVGTFYRSPSPDAAAYVEVGQMVRKGQTLCIIEAMKLMNEIEADVAGKVVSILVENAETVEFGQSLFVIEPS